MPHPKLNEQEILTYASKNPLANAKQIAEHFNYIPSSVWRILTRNGWKAPEPQPSELELKIKKYIEANPDAETKEIMAHCSCQKTLVARIKTKYGFSQEQIKPLNPEEKTIAREMWEKGFSGKDITEKLGRTNTRKITNYLKQVGDRVRHERNLLIKNNASVLASKTPEAYYWLGFLFADGHFNHKSQRLQIRLCAKDILHLYKLAKFIEFEGEVRTYKVKDKNDVAALYFSVDDCTWSYFKRIGMNRSSLLHYPKGEICGSRDFWRGQVDGDGWVCMGEKQAQKAVGLCGGQELVEMFSLFTLLNGIQSQPTIFCPYRHGKQGNTDYRRMSFSRTPAVHVARLLYENAPEIARLDRKYAKAAEMCGWNNHAQTEVLTIC